MVTCRYIQVEIGFKWEDKKVIGIETSIPIDPDEFDVIVLSILISGDV